MAAEKSPLNINKLVKNILTAISIGVLLFLLWYLRSVTIYLLCGVVLSLIARPLYIQLERIRFKKWKIPGAINALFSIALIWGLLGGGAAVLFPIIAKEGMKITKVDPEKLLKQIEKPVNNTVHELESLGLITFTGSDSIRKTPEKVVEKTIIYKLPCDSIYNLAYNKGSIFEPETDTLVKVTTVIPPVNKDSVEEGIIHRAELEAMIKSFTSNYVSVTNLSKWFGSVFSILGNVIATVVSASFLAFFFLRDKNLFKNMVLALVPEKHEKRVMVIMNDSRKMLSRYFIGLLIELLLVMICTSIGMLIIGIRLDLALTIGFFCGLFNIVPYLGPIIGGAVGLFLGLANYLQADAYAIIFPLMIKMAIVFAIVQVLDNNIFQTVIFSNSVNAHPIEIFFVIVIAGNIWGIVGMILAVPVYTFLRIIARHFFSQFKVVRELTQNM